MKAHAFDKNGFPKPLGLAFILTVLGIFCFILFLSGFSLLNNTYETVNNKTKKSEYSGNQKMESGEEQNGSVVTEEEAEQNEETKENKFSEANFSTALDFILKEAVEEKILIEEWMYDESFWPSSRKAKVNKNEILKGEEAKTESKAFDYDAYVVTPERLAELLIEEEDPQIEIDWSEITESNWGVITKDELFESEIEKLDQVIRALVEEEIEEEIKIEPWMYEEKYWPSGKKKKNGLLKGKKGKVE
ncbi:hypothetical protein ES705_12346 [subsurface metagenome]